MTTLHRHTPRALLMGTALAVIAACAPAQAPRDTGSADAPEETESADDGAPISAIPELEDPDELPAEGEADDGATIARDALAAVRGDAQTSPSDASTAQDGVLGASQGADPAAGSGPGPDIDPQADEGADAPRGEQIDLAEEQVDPPAPEQPVSQGDAPAEVDSGAPNVVDYALSTQHAVGETQHSRRGLFAERRFQRNCAEFENQDLAQEEFLRQGGPEEDPLGLDPNGDGFACWWDPEPYRAAARAE